MADAVTAAGGKFRGDADRGTRAVQLPPARDSPACPIDPPLDGRARVARENCSRSGPLVRKMAWSRTTSNINIPGIHHQTETALSGMWLFLVTELLFFGALFLLYMI